LDLTHFKPTSGFRHPPPARAGADQAVLAKGRLSAAETRQVPPTSPDDSPSRSGPYRGHIRVQFLSEAMLLALLGGAAGVALGGLATAIFATAKHWAIVIPAIAWTGGLAAALVIGAAAGLLPALRAARLSPTEALWTI